MNTQKRIDLTVEFTKNPRFSHITEAAPLKDARIAGLFRPRSNPMRFP
jgi:hypothetical protein